MISLDPILIDCNVSLFLATVRAENLDRFPQKHGKLSTKSVRAFQENHMPRSTLIAECGGQEELLVIDTLEGATGRTSRRAEITCFRERDVTLAAGRATTSLEHSYRYKDDAIWAIFCESE